MIVNYELGRIWKEAAVAYFKIQRNIRVKGMRETSKNVSENARDLPITK
jgi:hypothetical protein